MPETVETTWEQLPEVVMKMLQELKQQERARNVELIVSRLPAKDVVAVNETPAPPKTAEERAEWVRRFREWAASHAPLPHEVDDSRDTIYAEAVRDPR